VPDCAFTIDLANALFEAGMDSLELGMPFSDPIADGVVIETAGEIAIGNGFVFDDLATIARALTGRDIMFMGYTNTFYRRGFERVAKEARSLGISAALIPDLPHEEAAAYKPIFAAQQIALIEFVAPTTPSDRIASIVAEADKFIYLVAYAGITGATQEENLRFALNAIKAHSSTPVYVGFGVSRNTARKRSEGADGVIVGSAFVKTLIDKSVSPKEKIRKITEEARIIKDVINS
jgi:tryptophan synthase alpha chain